LGLQQVGVPTQTFYRLLNCGVGCHGRVLFAKLSMMSARLSQNSDHNFMPNFYFQITQLF